MTSSNVPKAGVIQKDTELVFDFNQQLDPNTISNSLTVRSNYRGLIAGTITSIGNVLKYKPLSDFQYGEEITITILKSLKSVTSQSITSPISIRSIVETKIAQANPPVFIDREFFRAPEQNLGTVAAADLDNDSDIDLIVGSNTIKWFENVGEAEYTIHSISESNTHPFKIKIADMDSDGDMDIISANSSNLSLLLNNGNQSFTLKILKNNVQSFDVVDFDADGLLDVVIINNIPNAAQSLILINQGNFFSEQKILDKVGYDLKSIDLDLDGDWDILMADDHGLHYYTNANGVFSLTSSIASIPVYDFNMHDYDGDGDYDIVCIGELSVDLYMQTASGNFTRKVIQNSGLYDGRISSGDFDGDHDIDIVVPDYTHFNLLINNGSADFQPEEIQNSHSQPGFSFAPKDLTIADLDSDGDLDFCSLLNRFQLKSYKNTTLSEAYLFSAVQSAINQFSEGDSDWADFDNDGDLDLLVSGLNNNLPATTLYKNENGQFVEVSTQLPGVYLGSCDWGDFDNDGDYDILLMGATSTDIQDRKPITAVYSNDAGNFSYLSTAKLPGMFYGKARWADFDNDGKLDFIVLGHMGPQLYHSQGGGTFTEKVNIPLPQVYGVGSVDLADFDGDGDMDIALSGWGGNDNIGAVLSVLRNDGNWMFTSVAGNFTGRIGGNVNWADIDSDGDLDLIASGNKRFADGNMVASNTVYRYGEGAFEEVVNTDFLYFTDASGTAAIGDFDNNGVPDLMASTSGGSSVDPKLTLLKNNGLGELSPVDIQLPSIGSRTANWIDYDRDHDLDIFVQTQLLRNNIEKKNSIPDPPTQVLIDSVFNNSIYYHWNTGVDQETAPTGLSYQPYVGTSSKLQNILNSNSELETGTRKVSELGQVKGTRSKVTNLNGGYHYIGVQSIDAAFEGSVFSNEAKALVIAILGKSSSCKGLNVSYVARPAGSYNWQIGGGTLIDGQGTDSIVVNWSQVGTGFVKVIDNENNKNTLLVEVEQKPQPKIIGDPSVCTGVEKYKVTDPLSISFLWQASQTNKVSNETANEATVSWEKSGEQKILVRTFPKNLGCFSSDSLIVLVDKRPVPKLSGITQTCAEYLNRYQADVENSVWTIGNGINQIDSIKSVWVKWNKVGNGFVSVRSNSQNNYCTVYDTLKVKVNESPAKPFLQLKGDTLISSSSPVRYYEWYFNQKLVVNGPYNGLILGGNVGTFQVAVFNSWGCGALSDPFVITDIHEQQLEDLFFVYPSPFSDRLEIKVECEDFGVIKFVMYSSSGKQVREESFDKTETNFKTNIDTSMLSAGIYLLNITIGNKTMIKKIVKN